MPRAGRKMTRRRRKDPAKQLEFWSAAAEVASGRPDLVPTSVLLRHRSCPRVLELIRQVRLFFPELDGITIKVGLTRSAAGLASREEPWIWLNPRKLTRHTVAHEFVHLLQARGLVPSGEKSADLFALARHTCLVDDLPFYLVTPRPVRRTPAPPPHFLGRLLHEVAREAVSRREGGHRTYLKWFEDEFAARWETRGAPPSTGSLPPVQVSLF